MPDEGCFICGKPDHFARQCPESHINKKGKKREQKQKEESYIGYSKTNKEERDSDEDSSENDILFASSDEPSKWPIIDSGASESVISEKDVIKGTKSLSRHNKNIIFATVKNERKVTFKFGTGQTVRANNTILMPMKWKQETFKLKLHVIPHPVPFLIGIEAMKKMEMMLDLKNVRMCNGSRTEKISRNKSGYIVWKSLRIRHNNHKNNEDSDEEAENVKLFYGVEKKKSKTET